MFSLIEVQVTHDLLLPIVEEPAFEQFNLRQVTFKKTMFKRVEMVEIKVNKELYGSCGDLMHGHSKSMVCPFFVLLRFTIELRQRF